MTEVVTDLVGMMEVTVEVVVTWEDLVTPHSKEDSQGVMEEVLVDMEILVLPGVWVVLAMVMGGKALETVGLGPAVVMEEHQGVIMEQIKEDTEEETLHLLVEIPGVIVTRGIRKEGIKDEATVTFMM